MRIIAIALVALLVLGCGLAGAALYRIRGGVPWNPLPGTQAARAIWALPTGAFLTALAAAPWWLALPLALAEFLGLALIGHGAVQGLGTVPWAAGKAGTWAVSWIKGIEDPATSPGRRAVLDFYGLTVVGWLRGAPVFALLWWCNPPAALAAFAGHALMGVAYVTGRLLPLALPGLVHDDWRRPTEAGEFLTGFLIWLPPAIVASTLLPDLAVLTLTFAIPGLAS